MAIALTTACGSSWGEGGDPAEIVAGFAFELELYDVDVYMEQNIPDALRDSFENTRAEFERYGIDFDDVNNFAKALVDCCAYSNVTQLQGSRVYIVDGTFEPDSVRSALEEELYESGTSGGYEIWENRALPESFMLLDRVAVGFIPDEGYLVIGDIDGVKEVLHMQSGAGSSDDDSAMRQVLSRIGDTWRETGRLDAQTYNRSNTHCAPGIRYNQFCQATAYHTSHAGGTLKTVIVSRVRQRRSGPVRVRSPREESGEHRDLRAHRCRDRRPESRRASCGSDSGTPKPPQPEGKQHLLGFPK